ncbi:E3 ubiquitin-protein ligase ATL42-like [Rhodamnia argentea]|uniref:RING-type E3 ubiquitin transferase n=1 Tax=Rhodamnia argentea TaxID=178133 RepID=A0A8B8Q7J8_9MYRT|nr:E3 ubiquitin-protein ligase ATL42-like [Rhodamnia argentea]
MKNLGALSVIFLLLKPARAQNPVGSSPDPETIHPVHPSMVVIVGVLAMMLSLTFLVLAYAKFCHRNPSSPPYSDTRNDQGLNRSRPRFSGIDQNVIDSLPLFRFSSLRGSKEGLECAVCINKFEDSETLRLLPQCKHAFHSNCIDQWLKSHSSCPLCRDKFNPRDLTNFAYSLSLRFSQWIPSNLSEDANLELIVQREADNDHGSSRYSDRISFRYSEKGPNLGEECLNEESGNCGRDQKLLHKFKHKIIISDVVTKSRWSDVNSSDLLFLNSELINVFSSRRFADTESRSGRFNGDFTLNEHLAKIKEDIERKRLFQSKVGTIASSSNVLVNPGENSLVLMNNPAEKRSMSEIVNLSRFAFSSKRRNKEGPGNDNGREERMRQLWLPMVCRTVQWFAGRERDSREVEEKARRSNIEDIL